MIVKQETQSLFLGATTAALRLFFLPTSAGQGHVAAVASLRFWFFPEFCIFEILVLFGHGVEEFLNEGGVTLMPLPYLALVSLNMAPTFSAYSLASL